MSEPSRPAPPSVTPSNPWVPSKRVEFILYASAAISYVWLAIYNKWLLDWIVGPFWLVAWVWGLPALVRLARRQPVKPRRGPFEEPFEAAG
jgi:hypothetical protein